MPYTLLILAFRGMSTHDPAYHRVVDALIHAGHCGVLFYGDPIIYGFHPTQAEIARVGSREEAVQWLWEKHTLFGAVQDDTETFVQAHRYSLSGSRTGVWQLRRDLGRAAFNRIHRRLVTWYTQGRDDFNYKFPPVGPDADNCVTFLERRAGIAIPPHSTLPEAYGLIRLLIPEMQRFGTPWEPEGDV